MRSGRLVFDGACGFCTRSAGWLQAVDRGRRIDLVPLQAPGVPESIGASRDECERALQWLGDDGRRRSGADAVNAAVSAVLGTSLPLGLYRLTSWPQERVYRWVAEHRQLLPGATPFCSEHPEACA